MRSAARKPGFALLMVLVLVFLAGAALAGIARLSFTEAVDARNAAERLKRRWAVASLRNAVAGRIENILDEAERGGPADPNSEIPAPYRNAPMPEMRIRCRLADIDYQLVLTDEQAKPNANHLLLRHSPAEVQSMLRGQTRDHAVKFQPLPKPTPTFNTGLPRVGGYGQIFPSASPGELLGDLQAPGPASLVTCWSDGKVNIRRARPDAMELACRDVVDSRKTRELLGIVAKDPYLTLSAAVDQVPSLTRDEKDKLYSVLTDKSTCHGLWIVAGSDGRLWYTLLIHKGAPASAAGGEGTRRHRLPSGTWREFVW